LVHGDCHEQHAPQPQPGIADDGERSATNTCKRAHHQIGKEVAPARPANLRYVQTS
jgi:hypothetical protein